jgi:hypothetical protein
MGQPNRLVIGGIGGVVRPPLIAIDRETVQCGCRRADSIGAVPDLAQREQPDGCSAVAFPFGRCNAAAAQRGPYPFIAPSQPAVGADRDEWDRAQKTDP